MNNKFESGDIITHIKTGGKYNILVVPDEYCKIESTGKTCYYYEDINAKQGWLRPKDEMEDGRFEKVKL